MDETTMDEVYKVWAKVEELEKKINELEYALLSVTMALKAVSSSVGGLTNVTEKIVERMNYHV